MTEFMDEVVRYGEFERTERARDATEATLDVLGTRIARGEAESIAGHLPEQAANWVIPQDDEAPRRLGVQEFVEYVASQTDVPTQQAWDDTEAVLAALIDRVPEKDARGIVTELPPEYDRVFSKADIDVPEGPA